VFVPHVKNVPIFGILDCIKLCCFSTAVVLLQKANLALGGGAYMTRVAAAVFLESSYIWGYGGLLGLTPFDTVPSRNFGRLWVGIPVSENLLQMGVRIRDSDMAQVWHATLL
jgi:hypothetical protein